MLISHLRLAFAGNVNVNLMKYVLLKSSTSNYRTVKVLYSLNMSDSEESPLFQGVTDRYNGITVDSRVETCNENTLSKRITDSLQKWNEDSKRTIWFKVDIVDAHWVPLLASNGFNFHHARDNFVMMYKWLPKTPHNLPPSAHTNIGVGAVLINENNEILVVSEKYLDVPHWKLPGGYVERGEDIVDAAVREVKEETGIDGEFHSVIGFRHIHNMMFGYSDIYLIVNLIPKSVEIQKCDREIQSCRWMDVNEYLHHPHVHAFNRLLAEKTLEYRNKKIKFDCEKKTLQFASFKRETMVYTLKDITISKI